MGSLNLFDAIKQLREGQAIEGEKSDGSFFQIVVWKKGDTEGRWANGSSAFSLLLGAVPSRVRIVEIKELQD